MPGIPTNFDWSSFSDEQLTALATWPGPTGRAATAETDRRKTEPAPAPAPAPAPVPAPEPTPEPTAEAPAEPTAE